jgi:hypothetical protein
MIAFLVALVVTPLAAHAAGIEQFGGWEGDSRGQGFGFAGAGFSLPVARHVGIPVSISGSYLYYGYDSGGSTVAVQSPGVSLLTGLRAAGPRGSASAMVGAENRWERRVSSGTPDVVGQHATLGAVFQTYDDLVLSRRWYASVFGIYVGAADYLIGRATLRRQMTNLDWSHPRTLFFGIEGVRQGNQFSSVTQAGGFMEWSFPPKRISLGLHAGFKESGTPGYPGQRGGYAGISIYRGS